MLARCLKYDLNKLSGKRSGCLCNLNILTGPFPQFLREETNLFHPGALMSAKFVSRLVEK